MANDGDDKDVSGLTLAKGPAYRPVPKIILTGFLTYQAVREALGPALDGLPLAVDLLGKQQGVGGEFPCRGGGLRPARADQWDLVIR